MYDLIVIGGGWAGFNAAVTAKEHGLKVALVEKGRMGGTCLNQGCIPTKALIQSAKQYTAIKKAQQFGIELACPPQLNFSKVQARKDRVVQQLGKGLEFLLKSIDCFSARATIISGDSVRIDDKTMQSANILIATGAAPSELKGLPFDGEKIISSNEIIEIKKVPSSLLIVGGGVIGCEFACLFSSFGSRVTIVELTPQLLPGEDHEVSRKLEQILKKKAIEVLVHTDVSSIQKDCYDLILVCVGRTPCVQGLGLEKLGVELNKGALKVDEHLVTNIAHLYAAGDCTGSIMLAHYAAFQGRMAALHMAQASSLAGVSKSVVPSCIFTDPEIASVGLNEQEALQKNYALDVYKFDFLGSGMARILDETDGFIKIVAEKKTGRLLGASIIGPRATELIGIISLAVQSGKKVSELKDVIFAHPTLSEAIGETFKVKRAV